MRPVFDYMKERLSPRDRAERNFREAIREYGLPENETEKSPGERLKNLVATKSRYLEAIGGAVTRDDPLLKQAADMIALGRSSQEPEDALALPEILPAKEPFTKNLDWRDPDAFLVGNTDKNGRVLPLTEKQHEKKDAAWAYTHITRKEKKETYV